MIRIEEEDFKRLIPYYEIQKGIVYEFYLCSDGTCTVKNSTESTIEFVNKDGITIPKLSDHELDELLPRISVSTPFRKDKTDLKVLCEEKEATFLDKYLIIIFVALLLGILVSIMLLTKNIL